MAGIAENRATLHAPGWMSQISNDSQEQLLVRPRRALPGGWQSSVEMGDPKGCRPSSQSTPRCRFEKSTDG